MIGRNVYMKGMRTLCMCLAALSMASCATMGKQYIQEPFPSVKRIYVMPELYDIFGGDSTLTDTRMAGIWIPVILQNLMSKGYTIVDDADEADLIMTLRDGNTRSKVVVGMMVYYSGYRIQIADKQSEKLIFNRWVETPTNIDGRYVRECEKIVVDFTNTVLSEL